MDKQLVNSIQEALLLGKFKSFCEKNSSVESQQRLRTIYSHSPDKLVTTKNLFINETGEILNEEELGRMYELVVAFLKKNNYRKTISNSVKLTLLKNQNFKCAICGKEIDMRAHADHTVPFKYVGDKLSDNYQMLCSNCNLKKNASIDYQIRYLLKSI